MCLLASKFALFFSPPLRPQLLIEWHRQSGQDCDFEARVCRGTRAAGGFPQVKFCVEFHLIKGWKRKFLAETKGDLMSLGSVCPALFAILRTVPSGCRLAPNQVWFRGGNWDIAQQGGHTETHPESLHGEGTWFQCALRAIGQKSRSVIFLVPTEFPLENSDGEKEFRAWGQCSKSSFYRYQLYHTWQFIHRNLFEHCSIAAKSLRMLK